MPNENSNLIDLPEKLFYTESEALEYLGQKECKGLSELQIHSTQYYFIDDLSILKSKLKVRRPKNYYKPK